jgi:hypothetical protein
MADKGTNLWCKLTKQWSLLMAGKQRARESTWSIRSLGGAKPARYTCVNCDEPRSPSYHARHPSNKPPPPQGLCRICVEKIRAKSPPPTVTIYEIHHHHTHHYYYTCKQEQHCLSESWHDDHGSRSPGETPSHYDMSRAAELPSSPASSCVELPAEDQQRRPPAMHQLFEQTPPLVMSRTKPSY